MSADPPPGRHHSKLVLRNALGSSWRSAPLWVKGAVCALALYAAVLITGIAASRALGRTQMHCLDATGQTCIPLLIQAIVAVAALGPGLFVGSAQGGGLTPAAVAVPAAIYSAIGAICFHRLGAKRGFRIALLLMALVIAATLAAIYLGASFQ